MNQKQNLYDLSIDMGSSRTKADFIEIGQKHPQSILNDKGCVFFDTIISYNDEKKDFQFNEEFDSNAQQRYIFKDLIQYCFTTIATYDDQQGEEDDDQQGEEGEEGEENDDQQGKEDEQIQDYKKETARGTQAFENFDIENLLQVKSNIFYVYEEKNKDIFFKKYILINKSDDNSQIQYVYCPSFETKITVKENGIEKQQTTMISLFEIFLFIIREMIKQMKTQTKNHDLRIRNLILHCPDMKACNSFYYYFSKFLFYVFNFSTQGELKQDQSTQDQSTQDNFSKLTLNNEILKECCKTSIDCFVVVNESQPLLPTIRTELRRSFQVVDLGSYTLDSSIVIIKQNDQGKKIYDTKKVNSAKIGYYDLLYMIYTKCNFQIVGKEKTNEKDFEDVDFKCFYMNNQSINPHKPCDYLRNEQYIISMLSDEEKYVIREIGNLIQDNAKINKTSKKNSIFVCYNEIDYKFIMPTDEQMKSIYNEYNQKICNYIFQDEENNKDLYYILTGGGFMNSKIFENLKDFMITEKEINTDLIDKRSDRLSRQSIQNIDLLHNATRYDWTKKVYNQTVLIDVMWMDSTLQFIEDDQDHDILERINETEKNNSNEVNLKSFNMNDILDKKEPIENQMAIENNKKIGAETQEITKENNSNHQSINDQSENSSIENNDKVDIIMEERMEDSTHPNQSTSGVQDDDIQEIKRYKFSLFIPTMDSEKTKTINQNYIFKSEDEVYFTKESQTLVTFQYPSQKNSQICIFQENQSNTLTNVIGILQLKKFTLGKVKTRISKKLDKPYKKIHKIMDSLFEDQGDSKHKKFKITYKFIKEQQYDQYPKLEVVAEPCLVQKIPENIETGYKKVAEDILVILRKYLKSSFTLKINDLNQNDDCFSEYPEFFQPDEESSSDQFTEKQRKQYFNNWNRSYKNLVPSIAKKINLFDSVDINEASLNVMKEDHQETNKLSNNVFDNVIYNSKDHLFKVMDSSEKVNRISKKKIKQHFNSSKNTPKPFYIFDSVSEMDGHSLGDWLLRDNSIRIKRILSLIADQSICRQKRIQDEMNHMLFSHSSIIVKNKDSNNDDSDMTDDSDNESQNSQEKSLETQIIQFFNKFIKNQKEMKKNKDDQCSMLDFTKSVFGRTILIWYIFETMVYGMTFSLPQSKQLFGTCVGVDIKDTRMITHKILKRDLTYTDEKSNFTERWSSEDNNEIVYKSFSFIKSEIQIANKNNTEGSCGLIDDEKRGIEFIKSINPFSWFEMKFVYRGVFCKSLSLFCRMLSRDNNRLTKSSQCESELTTKSKLCITPSIPITQEIFDADDSELFFKKMELIQNKKTKKLNFIKKLMKFYKEQDDINSQMVQLKESLRGLIRCAISKDCVSGDKNRFDASLKINVTDNMELLDPIYEMNQKRIRKYTVSVEVYDDKVMQTWDTKSATTTDEYFEQMLSYGKFIRIKEPFKLTEEYKKKQPLPSQFFGTKNNTLIKVKKRKRIVSAKNSRFSKKKKTNK